MAACGSDFSFEGQFSTDDQVQLFTFTLNTGAVVTFHTYGFAGGTNSNGMVIAPGGFDPQLTWYLADGTEIGNNDDGGCGNVAEFNGACSDSFAQPFLPGGTYTLALSQWGNDPAGDLSDGFIMQGNPTYTASGNCGMFCDVNSNQDTGNWAVDILSVSSATIPSATPEPSTLLLGGLALLGCCMTRAFMRQQFTRKRVGLRSQS
jgi:hypothetical protein